MKRKGGLAIAAVLVLVLLALWSWSTQRAPVHERTHPPATEQPATQAPDAAAGAGSATDNLLEIPPTLPQAAGAGAGPGVVPDFLPDEAFDTLERIVRNGPFPYRQDGGVFQNRERRLPPQSRGYYREYTVETPGSPDRGARRIVTGGERGDAPPLEYYYTADHYRSFRRFDFDPAQVAR